MMKRKFAPFSGAVILIFAASFLLALEGSGSGGSSIKRLTYSGSNKVYYPSLSDDGRLMLYVLELQEEDKTRKEVRVMNVESGEERVLFRSGEKKAPSPFEKARLELGTKPPLLSGDGKVALFSLSVSEPAPIFDHYLAVASTDGRSFWLTDFPLEALKGKDLKSLDFKSRSWERVANYALSRDASRIACVVKGHMGPRRYGTPAGIMLIERAEKSMRTILAPVFTEKGWEWKDFPRNPLLGGGWAFCLSGNGKLVVFGAQSSEDKTDFDLYALEWKSGRMKKITDFHDRWFSLADISHDASRIVFFYNGKKKNGIGTYSVRSNGSKLRYLESEFAPRIELVDMSGDGRYILFKDVYRGMIYELRVEREKIAFDDSTPGYAGGIIPMDFPRFPSFWMAKIMSYDGKKILIVGLPPGKEAAEVYLLTLD